MLFGSVTAAPGKVMVRKLPDAAVGTVACAAEALATEPRAKTGMNVTIVRKSARFTRTSMADDDKGLVDSRRDPTPPSPRESMKPSGAARPGCGVRSARG